MPAIETAFRKQQAVLWARVGEDPYGEPKVAPPVELKVRWTWVQRQSLDPGGKTVVTDATVVLDRDVPMNSIMWEGRLEDWADGVELYEVVSWRKTPGLKRGRFRRLAGLARFRSKLPQVVP